MAFPIILTGGQVTVNTDGTGVEVPLICAGWGTHEEGFTELLRSPDMRGADFDMAGEETQAGLWTPVASTRSVPLYIVAECDHNGDPYTGNGARSNLAYLRTHVIAPPDREDRPDGTRQTTLEWDDDEYVADCRFTERISQPASHGWFLVLDVWIRQGEFQLVSS